MGHVLATFPQCNFSLGFTEISSQNHMLLLTECVWDFQNNALWDTQQYALFGHFTVTEEK